MMINTALVIVMIILVCFCWGYRNEYEKCRKQKNTYNQYYNILNKMSEKKCENNINDFIKENKINTIAIYGIGNVGKRLVEKFNNMNLKVDYIIDKNSYLENFDGIEVIKMDEINKKGKVDVVIVTPIYDIEQIKCDLKENKLTNIYTIYEIIEYCKNNEENIDEKNKLIEKIHAENKLAHNDAAKYHDKSVPYIRRKLTRRYYWNMINNTIKNNNKTIKGSAVLEIGCGTGTFTDLFLEDGCNFFDGIDLSDEMIRIAKTKYDNKNVNFYISSLEEYANNNEAKYDLIYSSSFLHHLPDVEIGLNLIKKMLKPEGIYIAIHEEINNRDLTLIEEIDYKLQKIFGYSGYCRLPLYERIFGKLSNENDGKSMNYIDYQLNYDFSLSKKCGNFGIVEQYCYLGFVELMLLGKPKNFEMLTMKRI